MSHLHTLLPTTLDDINHMVIAVVDIDGVKDGIAPSMMSVDARWNCAHLKRHIFRYFDPLFKSKSRGYKVRLTFFNQVGNMKYISGFFPLEVDTTSFSYVSNSTQLNSFLKDYALVRFQFYSCE